MILLIGAGEYHAQIFTASFEFAYLECGGPTPLFYGVSPAKISSLRFKRIPFLFACPQQQPCAARQSYPLRALAEPSQPHANWVVSISALHLTAAIAPLCNRASTRFRASAINTRAASGMTAVARFAPGASEAFGARNKARLHRINLHLHHIRKAPIKFLLVRQLLGISCKTHRLLLAGTFLGVRHDAASEHLQMSWRTTLRYVHGRTACRFQMTLYQGRCRAQQTTLPDGV